MLLLLSLKHGGSQHRNLNNPVAHRNLALGMSKYILVWFIRL